VNLYNRFSAVRARWLAIGILSIAVASGALAQRAPLPNPSGFNIFSKQQDVQLGKENAAQVGKQMPVLPDSSPVTQYVQRLGRKLGGVMPQPTYPYNFHVVQEKDINAFALPGGPIFVNLGTIQAADTEAQLAGVMAHEMSHVYMRHSTKMASRQMAAQLPLSLLGGMLGGSMAGQLARAGISFGVGSYFMKYSRDDEAQADAVGARIMYDAGYNPVAMANFFRKLDAEGGARGPQFFSDHPNPGNRVAAVTREISTFPARQFTQDSAQFQSTKQQSMRLKAYTAQEIQQGKWRR
jgi:predicted Zn-dependent protease